MKTIKKVSESYVGDTPIATSISSSSTNDEVAGAKAVYDSLPQITQVSLTPASTGITIYANHSCAIEFPTGKLVTICASIRGVSVSSGSWRKYRYNSRRL